MLTRSATFADALSLSEGLSDERQERILTIGAVAICVGMIPALSSASTYLIMRQGKPAGPRTTWPRFPRKAARSGS
jgi:hypothetical protein